MDKVILTENYIEDEKKLAPKEKKSSMGIVKVTLVLFFSLLAIIILGSIFIYGYYNKQINSPIKYEDDDSVVTISIEKGMGTIAIAELLAEKGIISRPEILRAYMFFNPDKTIQAGYYEVDLKDKNIGNLVDVFQSGSFERKLTFIEGWRNEEYVDYLRETMGDEFADKFAASDYLKEGYMFPDTYVVEVGYDPENLASTLRNTHDKRFSQTLKDKALLRNLTEDEVIKFASILEREMNIKKDRPLVAGILIKRYKEGWPLQADATLQYAKGNEKDWWPNATRDDYQNLNSPYNTYLNKGLPPTPIANPGLDAIQSVVNYQDSDYWFYITGADGTTHYAETLDEHNQNVAKYIR